MGLSETASHSPIKSDDVICLIDRGWRDSFMPQAPILLEKLSLGGDWALQTLARESLHIVAFRSAGTTSRTAGSISSSFLKRMRQALIRAR
jgi:hypothetical protein